MCQLIRTKYTIFFITPLHGSNALSNCTMVANSRAGEVGQSVAQDSKQRVNIMQKVYF